MYLLRTGSWLQNKVTKNEEMTMGICIAFIAVALIAGVAGANYGYTKGAQETRALDCLPIRQGRRDYTASEGTEGDTRRDAYS